MSFTPFSRDGRKYDDSLSLRGLASRGLGAVSPDRSMGVFGWLNCSSEVNGGVRREPVALDIAVDMLQLDAGRVPFESRHFTAPSIRS